METKSKRRLPVKAAAGLAAAALIAATAPVSAAPAAPAAPAYSQAQLDRWFAELSNWGRWGKNDQLGTLNFITTQKRLQAIALARTGVVVSMQKRAQLIKAPPEQQGNDIPRGVMFYEIHFRTIPPGDIHHNDGYSGEVQRFNPHGGYTHVDALCHDSDGKGHVYNGYELKTNLSEATGCLRNGLGAWPQGAIVTRGVLIDMTRLKAPHVAGAPVTVKDIEAFEKQANVHVSSGDALFVYNPGPLMKNGEPSRGGWDLSVLPWMKARSVALTSGFYSTPGAAWSGQVAGVWSADHRLVLAAMGMPLMDSPELKPLSEEAARQNRWEFMLVVAPAAVPGGTGQMVNPLALF